MRDRGKQYWETRSNADGKNKVEGVLNVKKDEEGGGDQVGEGKWRRVEEGGRR